MTAIRTVLVDDEPLARRGIAQLLAPHADIAIVGEARDGHEAVRVIDALAPDLVFLDVQLPELDGLDVARRLDPAKLPQIIFVTAYDRFAVAAFELHAIDYLVKPVREARFHDAVARARERFQSRAAVELAARLGQLLAGTQPDARRIAVATTAGEVVLDADDIRWIGADDYYATIHDAAGRSYQARESLASLETRLAADRFVRVHRGAVVNLACIRALRPDATLVLRDGTELAVSRRRREHVVAAMRRFAR